MSIHAASFSGCSRCAGAVLLTLSCSDALPPRAEPAVRQNGDAGIEQDGTLPRPNGVPADVVGPCGVRAAFGPTLQLGTQGAAGDTYDGPAIVERSTAAELVLYFQPATPATDAGADAGTASSQLPMHVGISGQDPMPLFPLGARVWLSKDPVVDPAWPIPGDVSTTQQPWSFSVRDRSGGRLLFGAARGSSGELRSPIQVDHLTPVCEDVVARSCGTKKQTIYSRLDVHGDVTVSVGDSETAIVPIGGFDYEVRVSAREELSLNRYCGDYSKNDGVAVELRAVDLESLIASLQTGELPACVEGNADMKSIGAGTTDRPGPYDARVLYQTRSLKYGQECFRFATEPAPNAPGQSQSLTFCVAEGLFPEPSPGQEFWATVPNTNMGALREPQRGALLLGHAAFFAPFTDEQTSLIEATFGVRVSMVERCPYVASGGEAMFSLDTVFETDPAQRLPSHSQGVVRLGDRGYDAWAYGLGSYAWFALVAR